MYPHWEEAVGSNGGKPLEKSIAIGFRGDELLKENPSIYEELGATAINIYELIGEICLAEHERGQELVGCRLADGVTQVDNEDYSDEEIDQAAERVYLDFVYELLPNLRERIDKIRSEEGDEPLTNIEVDMACLEEYGANGVIPSFNWESNLVTQEDYYYKGTRIVDSIHFRQAVIERMFVKYEFTIS